MAGYISVEHKKDLTSIFFILHPDFWNSSTEARVIETIIDHVAKVSKDQIEICVMPAYEKSLTMVLDKMGYMPEKAVSRLGLVKKLEEIHQLAHG